MTEQHETDAFEQGVMVDVGSGAGALVIYTRDDMRGQEVEISPTDRESQRTHTEVLRRRIAGGYVNAAVFGSLAEGTYRLWHQALLGPTEVRIMGGLVTELDWR